MPTTTTTLADPYLAYRKAKAEAYYENTHFHALAFARYETALDRNLQVLLERLQGNTSWETDANFLGGFYYAPKSVDNHTSSDSEIFFRSLDPQEEWNRRFEESGSNRATAKFRLIIAPTVDLQVISALWLIKVGYLIDACVDRKLSFGNRLRMRSSSDPAASADMRPNNLNLDCTGLFAPYFSAYRAWRERGLAAIEEGLKDGNRLVAVTMDIEQFYHRVSPRFLLRESFLAAVGIRLTAEQHRFTSLLVGALDTWYRQTPDYRTRPEGALPIGLSASKVIANALLAEFDRKFSQRVRPLYYGRYVDDLFIVLEVDRDIGSGNDILEVFVRALPEYLTLAGQRKKPRTLRLKLKYAADSLLLFTGNKQKVFNMAGAFGLDLVAQITEHIRRQSSEHRMLPVLPATSEAMAGRALLAQPQASLEADALRKADVISVRRLGLAILLRDVECYARDLPPHRWKERRNQFYGLVNRHVITPSGFFEFFPYTHRVFGLMVACGDWRDAISLVRRLVETADTLKRTTTAGTTDAQQFQLCKSYYGKALVQAALQASTVARFRWDGDLRAVLRSIRQLDDNSVVPARTRDLRALSQDLLYADFGRRPYRELWLHGSARARRNPPVPRSLGIRRVLRLGAIRKFRRLADLPIPYWPALAFSTRPMTLSEITQAAPSSLGDPSKLRTALFGVRGTRARWHDGIDRIPASRESDAPEVVVQCPGRGVKFVAIPSVFTDAENVRAALNDRPRLTLARYDRLRKLINGMCEEAPRPQYVVFPECSVPRAWAGGIAFKLAQQRISFLCGLEYKVTPQGVRNDVFVSLTTDWPWYAASVHIVQPKLAAAHDERRMLWKEGRKRLFVDKKAAPPVYVHGNVCFGILICSDLTNVVNRTRFQGVVDALFVLEWNPDLDTFSFLVESAAHDLHAYVVQVNNRMYGDSRVRVPRKKPYDRDAVRVRGGVADYFVIAELDVESLRAFQRKPVFGDNAEFKPLPIGYKMSQRRQTLT